MFFPLWELKVQLVICIEKENQDLSAEGGQADYNLDRDGKEKETLENTEWKKIFSKQSNWQEINLQNI